MCTKVGHRNMKKRQHHPKDILYENCCRRYSRSKCYIIKYKDVALWSYHSLADVKFLLNCHQEIQKSWIRIHFLNLNSPALDEEYFLKMNLLSTKRCTTALSDRKQLLNYNSKRSQKEYFFSKYLRLKLLQIYFNHFAIRRTT